MRVVLEVFLIFTTSLALPPDVVESLLNGNSNGKVQGLKDPTITVFTENMKQIFGSSANMEARRVRLQRLSQKSKVNMTEADKEQIRLNLMLLEELPTKETPGIDDLNKAAGLSEYLFQGDIQLTDDQLTQLENDFTASGRKKRQASSVFRKWTGNVLYFYFDSTVPAQTKTAVNNAVQYLEANTCVRFQQSSNAANRVRVTRGDSGCNSIVGMAGGEQIMNLEDGCGYVEVTAHEFMHALGMWHIQNRPDRDGYITVNIASVDPELVSSYDKISQITNYVPYEYGSVMHYSATAFASRVGAITMVPKDSRYMNTMGSPIISFFDLKAINDHYGCSALCPSSSSAQCKNGGIPNPRQCSICICPQGYGGQLCDQRPSGCGETLTATSSWQTRTFTVSTRSSAQPEYYMCNHWITAPAGQKIQVKVTQMSNPSCDYGCHPSGIELKVNADQRITNPRLCCRSSLNQEFTSAVNPTPIFSYSRYSYSESFTIQYKAVGGPINPEPTNGCQDATISCGTWASNGFCSSSDYPLQAKKDFCPKTCNLCGESSNSCKDSSLSCATWIKNSDFCRNTDYPLAERKRYCAASCNLC